jgi:hypothetical protein
MHNLVFRQLMLFSKELTAVHAWNSSIFSPTILFSVKKLLMQWHNEKDDATEAWFALEQAWALAEL